jgi:glyoxylase I family protein
VTVQRLSHIGLCVADLARSLRFYCEGLGFRELARLDIGGEPTATLLGIPGVELEARYLERDGTRLELLHYPVPGATGGDAARPMNACGFTHLSFRVADLDAATELLLGLGGRPLAATRVGNPRLGMGAVFLTDPDGARIELVEGPGDPDLLPGERV